MQYAHGNVYHIWDHMRMDKVGKQKSKQNRNEINNKKKNNKLLKLIGQHHQYWNLTSFE